MCNNSSYCACKETCLRAKYLQTYDILQKSKKLQHERNNRFLNIKSKSRSSFKT